MKFVRIFYISLVAALISSTALGEVSSSGRHVYILHKGLDKIVGSYLFLVSNSSATDEFATIPVLVPKGMVDFIAAEGVKPEEIKLSSNGEMIIEKTFKPGEQLVSINFSLKASLGSSEIEIIAPETVNTLKFMTPTGTLGFLADKNIFKTDKEVPFSKRVYDTITAVSIKKGQKIYFKIDNVPEGRTRFWILGSIVGLVSLVAMVSIALFKEKKTNYSEFIV